MIRIGRQQCLQQTFACGGTTARSTGDRKSIHEFTAGEQRKYAVGGDRRPVFYQTRADELGNCLTNVRNLVVVKPIHPEQRTFAHEQSHQQPLRVNISRTKTSGKFGISRPQRRSIAGQDKLQELQEILAVVVRRWRTPCKELNHLDEPADLLMLDKEGDSAAIIGISVWMHSTEMTSSRPIHPWCIATVTSAKAITTLTENDQGGAYRDNHPWLIAEDLWRVAESAGESMPILLAVHEGNTIAFSHYAFITSVEVLAKQLGGYDSVCRFTQLLKMHPIWSEIDSVALKPTAEQLAREHREDLHQHRFHLTSQLIRPYAICETPAFLLAGLPATEDSKE